MAQNYLDMNYLAVAVIDFGTTYTGIAISLKDEFKRNPLNIECIKPELQTESYIFSHKEPTAALYNSKKEFHSFGAFAEETYAEMAENNEESGWIFFKHFKMILYDEPSLSRRLMLKDEKGNSMPAMEVYSSCIKTMKKAVLKHVAKRGNMIHENEIRWVITIPAIWRDEAKQFMREAAVNAGISNEKLILALEPEAAAIYVQECLNERQVMDNGKIKIAPYSPGTKYMVVDAGGGTVDIALIEVLADRKLKQLHHATGGDWGCNRVNDKIKKFLVELFGEDVITELLRNHKGDFLQIEKEIESKKRLKDTITSKVAFNIPRSLFDAYAHINKKALTNVSAFENQEWKDKLNIKQGKLQIAKAFLRQFYQYSITKIIGHMQSLCQLEGNDICNIFLVGGFAESSLLRQAVIEAFKDKNVVVPYEPELSVLKGAVLFGHNTSIVSYRKANLTYGTRTMRYFLDGDDESKKILHNGLPYCGDIFNKLAEKDGIYAINEPIEGEEVTISNDLNTKMTIDFFSSTENNPKFVTEESCRRLGKIPIKNKKMKGEGKVKPILIFGDTEIFCELEHVGSGFKERRNIDMLLN